MADPETSERQKWMAVLARADVATLELASAGLLPEYALIRGPEAGLVMMRGRAGGSGAPFNLGEATVVRCTVRSGSGHLGHSYCLGRDLRQAELAAAMDAGLQDPALRPKLQAAVTSLAEAQAAARTQDARRAAATQVQFFTMATMRT